MAEQEYHSNETGMIERMCRAASDATIIGEQYRDPVARASKVDECWPSWVASMRAALAAMREPTGYMMEDGARACRSTRGRVVGGMSIEAQYLAETAPFRAGWSAAVDAALADNEVKTQPDDVMTRFRRGETITLAELTADE